MSAPSLETLEERVAAIEAEIAQMKGEAKPPAAEKAGWKKIVGVFKDDPEFEAAMRLGREYRESLRPKDDEQYEAQS